MTKSFKKNAMDASRQFLSNATLMQDAGTGREGTQVTDKEPEQKKDIPLGYHIAPEKRTKRVALKVSPKVFDAMRERATKEEISANELINRAIIDYLKA